MEHQAWDHGVEAWSRYVASPEGRRRDEISWKYLEGRLDDRHGPLRCLDVGCGTGEIGLRLVAAGHICTFLDISKAMLERVSAALARARHPAARRASVVQGDLTDTLRLPQGVRYDVIVAHSVLEFVPDLQAGLQTLFSLLQPAGILSLVVANAWGVVMKAALEQGDPEQALAALDKAPAFCSQSFGAVGRSRTPRHWLREVKRAGLRPEAVYGGRILADFALAGATRVERQLAGKWLRLELALGMQQPFRDVGRVVQIIATRDPEPQM